MSTTTFSTSATIFPTTSSTTTIPLTDDTTWDFSIKETTIRNVTITLGITLGLLLICALTAIEIMRRRMQKLRHQRDGYKEKFGGPISPSLMKRSGSGYGPLPPSAGATGRTGYEPVPATVVESGRGQYQHLSLSAIESGRAELSGTEGRIPVFAR
ncbi:hypothetical protein DOTSEDRAFT_71939 [Dothistroma septosporum NZE10]|uniref:Uncharacterized protein n=1 Tax=Dothistroma septosporum (strain NZE10 / CBS 128990) TaxID=675120 RepID=N1PLA0_DOTSN|nr:hypothetical protein DOTSEDRAFT_71939 [Dothistroma septosporum NZE10]